MTNALKDIGLIRDKKILKFSLVPGQDKSNFYLSCSHLTCPKYIVTKTCTEFFT